MTSVISKFRPLLILLIFAVTACAANLKPVPMFQAQPVDAGRYSQRVDHLIFILDGSSSMGEGYGEHLKFDIARAFVRNFNNTMPDMNLSVALHTFGHADSVSSKAVDVMMARQAYSKEALAAAIDKVSAPGGTSPLASSLKRLGSHMQNTSGPVAVVVVSDGKDMGLEPLKAAEGLKALLNDRLCLYTVLVGDAADGRSLMNKLAAVTGCGASINADDVNDAAAMNRFVRDTLFTAKNDRDGDGVPDDRDQCPGTAPGVKVDRRGCPLDSDKDGVIDAKDQCPGTPGGTIVDEKGCPVPKATKSAEVTAAGTWIYKDIQFENNKADLRQSSFETLNEIVAALKAQKNLRIEIQGHTDSSGTRAYNIGLSQRRAASVRAYLVSQGIESSRLTTKGFGPDRPIASNATKEGRAKNRRVEIKPIR